MVAVKGEIEVVGSGQVHTQVLSSCGTAWGNIYIYIYICAAF